MPRKPPSLKRRLPAGLLAATALETLDRPQPGNAVLDRLLQSGAGITISAEEVIHLRHRPQQSELS